MEHKWTLTFILGMFCIGIGIDFFKHTIGYTFTWGGAGLILGAWGEMIRLADK